ncbi:hypothetical protein ENSA5_03150 [Enhygromyxa salina]|uniref:DUF2264 domain-containing protein n=1 Tax=Enhygromyxa salina TaxID=215803 RepID=A0A2S9YJQ2_9BACT|nr:DUF2264 domain-containing protein [Enhygromyxa salina]PRQ05325.1 hypothetical protein ENSA5_03150 [Enhygromyxa salina]
MVRRHATTVGCVLALCVQLGCGRSSDPPRSDSEAQLETSPARVIALDPAEDRERAPYTGWTRAHYEAVFARMVLGFVDHRSEHGARTRYVGGEHLPASMEGAIRMLPALGAWLACPCNPERISVEGRELDIAAIAREIVVNGTNPRSVDYWYEIGAGWDQRKVEGATVAEFLVDTRARVWDRCDPYEQAKIMAWLRSADEPLASNWLAFQIARNTARLSFDRPVSAAALSEQLDLLERDYEGDGFYRDGAAHRFDWYNAFVIHPELSFWRRAIDHEGERARVERIAARTRAYLGHLPYLMDREGRVPPIGRSLAYRSAVLAALESSVLAGDEFVAPGLARRMSSGNLRHHVEAGMFAPDQTLTLGHHGEQPRVLENYVRPGSQYFATRGLAVLALPPEHPFWTATEQPLPADLGDFVHALPAIGWTVEYEREGAGLTLHNVRASTRKAAYHDRYKKLSYAPLTWFAQETEGHRPYDASVISAANQRFDRRRSGAQSWAVAPGFAWTRYAMVPEQARTADELRPHWISTAALGGPSRRPLELDDGPALASVRLSCVAPSFGAPARPHEGSPAIVDAAARGASLGHGDPSAPWWYVDAGPGQSKRAGAAAVLLAGLHGWERAGPLLGWSGPVEHVLGGDAAFVGLGVEQPFEGPRCFASMQRVAAAPFDPAPVVAAAPEVEFEGSRATVRWRDGTLAWVELARDPGERVLELGPLRLTGPLRMAQTAELDGLRTLVAVGLRSVSDSQGPLLKAFDARTLVACELEDRRVRCEIDGPVFVRRSGPEPLTLRWREPLWTGDPGQARWGAPSRVSDDGTDWVAIDPADRGPRETTTLVFDLSS